MSGSQLATNPIIEIIRAIESQGVVGFMYELHRGDQGKALLHFNQRACLMLTHLPRTMPSLCVMPLTIARLERQWIITASVDEVQQWMAEVGDLLGDGVDDYGLAERTL